MWDLYGTLSYISYNIYLTTFLQKIKQKNNNKKQHCYRPTKTIKTVNKTCLAQAWAPVNRYLSVTMIVYLHIFLINIYVFTKYFVNIIIMLITYRIYKCDKEWDYNIFLTVACYYKNCISPRTILNIYIKTTEIFKLRNKLWWISLLY